MGTSRIVGDQHCLVVPERLVASQEFFDQFSPEMSLFRIVIFMCPGVIKVNKDMVWKLD